MIQSLTKEAQVGENYNGTVKKIVDFGAFVSILPNQEGLLHISEIDWKRVEKVEEYNRELKKGDFPTVLSNIFTENTCHFSGSF